VYAGDQDAALESNVFARENLVGSRHFGRPKETLEYALSLAPQGGMALEFGVASGNTLRTIARARGGEGVYSSAKTVLDLCGPRLRAGSIVHFDEFFNFPGWSGTSTAPGRSTSSAPASSSNTSPTPTTTTR
jgi:hypothetical protein